MKKIVRPLLAGVGVAGGIVAANQALRNAPLPINALGGTRRAWTWRGYEIFVTQAGHGPLVVLVHGVYSGASSYEYRKLFGLLARSCRVVAFDLLGCGLSDKPNLDYTTELFVAQVAGAFEAFGERPALVVASSLGAAFAVRAAAHAGAKAPERLALICPAGLSDRLARERDGGSPMASLVRAPLVGEAFYNALASKTSTRWFLARNVYADPATVTPDVLDHYFAVTHQPGSRYVPAAFIGGELNCDVARDLPFLDAPLLVMWGERARTLGPRPLADEWIRLSARATLVTFANSALLPQEEEPEAVSEAIASFLPAAAAPRS